MTDDEVIAQAMTILRARRSVASLKEAGAKGGAARFAKMSKRARRELAMRGVEAKAAKRAARAKAEPEPAA